MQKLASEAEEFRKAVLTLRPSKDQVVRFSDMVAVATKTFAESGVEVTVELSHPGFRRWLHAYSEIFPQPFVEVRNKVYRRHAYLAEQLEAVADDYDKLPEKAAVPPEYTLSESCLSQIEIAIRQLEDRGGYRPIAGVTPEGRLTPHRHLQYPIGTEVKLCDVAIGGLVEVDGCTGWVVAKQGGINFSVVVAWSRGGYVRYNMDNKDVVYLGEGQLILNLDSQLPSSPAVVADL